MSVELAWDVLKELDAYPELPNVRSAMEGTQGGGKVVTRRLRWFYILLTAAPVIFSAPLFFAWCKTDHGLGFEYVAEAAVVLYLVVTTVAILKVSPGARNESVAALNWSQPERDG